MSLKSVKSKIKSIDKTRQVTKAMEAVSAVKMRKSQERALGGRPYALSALKILQSVAGSFDGSAHPLAAERPVKKACMVVVTSDRGLAGSLNSAVLKEFGRTLERMGLKPEQVGIIAVGKRGYEYFSKRGFHIIDHFEHWGDFIDFEIVEPLIARIKTLFLEEAYDQVWFVYTQFISTLRQSVHARKVLPVTYAGVAEAVAGITPESGRYSSVGRTGEGVAKTPYTFEPSAETVLDELFPLLIKIEAYHSILEANASEHSARMMAMKNASDNARDILRDLRLSYNKARQAAITKEMSEIVGGTESLKEQS